MIKITADSSADLGYLFNEEQIEFLPLCINLDSKSYLDCIDIDAKKIFDVYDEKKILPKTAARSIEDYVEFFNNVRGDDESIEIIHFSMSSLLSASYSSAENAAKQLKNVYVIDTKTISAGIGLLALTALDMSKQGLSAKEIIDSILSIKDRVFSSAILSSMEFVHQGGRCSIVTKLIASILKIKIQLICKNGKIEVGQKFIGSFDKCALKYTDAVIKNHKIDESRIFIVYTVYLEDLINQIEQKLLSAMPNAKIYKIQSSCTVSCHMGKDTIGILFMQKE